MDDKIEALVQLGRYACTKTLNRNFFRGIA